IHRPRQLPTSKPACCTSWAFRTEICCGTYLPPICPEKISLRSAQGCDLPLCRTLFQDLTNSHIFWEQNSSAVCYIFCVTGCEAVGCSATGAGALCRAARFFALEPASDGTAIRTTA